MLQRSLVPWIFVAAVVVTTPLDIRAGGNTQWEDTATMCHGNIVTPENVASLGAQLSKEGEEVVRTWINQDQELINKLIHLPSPLIDAITTHQNNQTCISEKGLSNLSDYNYVFQLPNHPNLIVKIAGHINRICNVLERDGLFCALSQEKRARLAQLEPVATYQTVSRKPLAERLREAIEKRNLDRIKAPTTYLINLDTTHPSSDDNSIIIEERVENPVVKCEKGSEHINSMPTELVEQVYKAIKAGDLWSITKNTHSDGNNIYFFDLEQPNSSNPAHFFGKYTEKVISNASVGITEFASLFPEDAPQIIHLIALIKNDDEISNHAKSSFLKRIEDTLHITTAWDTFKS